MDFKWTNIWVQIHNVPIMLMTKLGAHMLAERAGSIVQLPLEDKDCWGAFIRAKVRVDVSKPLMRRANVKGPTEGGIHTVTFRYERLPDFCPACGCLNHSLNECLLTH